jgi:hypothetical protein
LSTTWVFSKSSFASYVLGLLGVYILIADKKINILKLILFVVFLLALIAAMYFITLLGSDNGNLEYISTLFMHRFFKQGSGVIYAFYIYPEILPFKSWTGVSSLLASINGDSFSSVYGELINRADPVNSDISGAMSSFAAGDAWGLFGYRGVLLGPIIVAFWYSLFRYLGNSNKLGIIFIGLYGIYFGNAVLASTFYSFIWPIGILFNIFPFLLFYMISTKKKGRCII